MKKLQIWRLPPILIIHLKRFQCVNSKWIKSHKIVDFPISGLDFTDYLAAVPAETLKRLGFSRVIIGFWVVINSTMSINSLCIRTRLVACKCCRSHRAACLQFTVTRFLTFEQIGTLFGSRIHQASLIVSYVLYVLTSIILRYKELSKRSSLLSSITSKSETIVELSEHKLVMPDKSRSLCRRPEDPTTLVEEDPNDSGIESSCWNGYSSLERGNSASSSDVFDTEAASSFTKSKPKTDHLTTSQRPSVRWVTNTKFYGSQ